MILTLINGARSMCGRMQSVLNDINFHDDSNIITSVDYLIDLEDKNNTISIKWIFALKYGIMPAFDTYCMHKYSISEKSTPPINEYLERIVKLTYRQFKIEFELKRDEYKLPISINELSTEVSEQVLQLLLAKLLPLHEDDKM